MEQRAEALLASLRGHRGEENPEPKFRGLADIARWFEEQKREIDAMPDARMRQSLLAVLKARYADLTAGFLKEV